jgi:hypothetical protein
MSSSGMWRRVVRRLETSNTILLSRNFSILKIEATRSSETSVLTRLIRRRILEDVILQFYVMSRFYALNFESKSLFLFSVVFFLVSAVIISVCCFVRECILFLFK